VGIMPLPDTDWTRYKCGLKILQYMALGIPAVASPVGVNAEMIRTGENGFLAEADERWLDVLERLVTSRTLRQDIGRAGRRTIEDGYSIQQHVPKLIETLAEAVARTGGRKEAQKAQTI
jgi:glycosyltransferase involved in cell wall biosynthesis